MRTLIFLRQGKDDEMDQLIVNEEQLLGRKLADFEIEELKRRIVFMKEHQGHESQHAEMLLILMSSLIISQILIAIWKKYHPQSYNLATLLGLWLVPVLMAIQGGHTRFIIVWILFSIANSLIVKV